MNNDMWREMMPELTCERVRFLFTYDENRGLLVRNFRRGKAAAGSHSTCCDRDGYLVVGIDGRIYRTHRIIWLYRTGEWPRGDIDHIDRSKDNNRFDNLRDVTKSQNKQNQVVSVSNKAGIKGVRKNNQVKADRWVAEIHVNGRKIILGAAFKTPEEAASAYAAAAAVLHEFNPCAAKNQG